MNDVSLSLGIYDRSVCYVPSSAIGRFKNLPFVNCLKILCFVV